MNPAYVANPWREPLPEDKLRVRPVKSWPPKMPGPIEGDTVSPEHAQAIADYEAYRDQDLAA